MGKRCKNIVLGSPQKKNSSSIFNCSFAFSQIRGLANGGSLILKFPINTREARFLDKTGIWGIWSGLLCTRPSYGGLMEMGKTGHPLTEGNLRKSSKPIENEEQEKNESNKIKANQILNPTQPKSA